MLDTQGGHGAPSLVLWLSVYDAIRLAILSHNLLPGTKLPEDEIGDVYSVSRTVVRAALQALSHDKLVLLEPKRGAFVAQPSKQEAHDVFEARALIEPKVAALAAEVAKPADVKRLRRHLDDEHRALEGGDDGEAVLLSGRFHVAIAEIAGQIVYTEFVKTLCSRSSLIISMHWRRHDTFCESHAHHALVDAIAKNSPVDAAELMTSHLVDLLSGLDLRPREASGRSLTDILRATKKRERD
jgi:DNA-binding GntR family transcriptional regulator